MNRSFRVFLLVVTCATFLASCGGNDSSSLTQTTVSQSKALHRSEKALGTDYTAVLEDLYVAYFGRPADPGGLTYWGNLLAAANAPTTLNAFMAAFSTNPAVKAVINDFGTSAESTALYGTNNTAIVIAIYQNLFNRPADPAGLSYWVDLLNNHGMTQAQAALSIALGAQGTDALSVQNKVAVATQFSGNALYPEQLAAYSGLNANSAIRAVLATVGYSSDVKLSVASMMTTFYPMVSYTVGGTITGLQADGLVLSDGTDQMSVAPNASTILFPTRLQGGAVYDTTIVSQPPAFSDVCTVGNPSGAIGNLDITNITVTCRPALPAVTTFAGSTSTGSANGVGTAASFYGAQGIAADSSGNVYVADSDNQLIREISPSGMVTTLAGSTFGSKDGPAASARFANPIAVAVDNVGNVYVADTSNHLIRKISPQGVVSTLAGSSGYTGSANGVGTAASFFAPEGVAVDGVGNVYVADVGNNMIRKITPQGLVTTLAGSGVAGSADGLGTQASFNQPTGVAVDAAGNVYVNDYENQEIRKITPDGIVTTLAGNPGVQGAANGTGSAASFNVLRGVTADAAGNVYVADELNFRIRMITPAGVVTTLAGNHQGSANGNGTAASFNELVGIAADTMGNLYVLDGNMIRKISPR